jgi:hypothetical protein
LFGRGKRNDIDEEDNQESYFRYMEENPMAGVINDEDEDVEYDDEGNPIIPDKKVAFFVSIRYCSHFFCFFFKYLKLDLRLKYIFESYTNVLFTENQSIKFNKLLID